MTADDCLKWCDQLGLECVLIFHLKTDNHFGFDFCDFADKISPITGHLHIGDALDLNGEGLQIGSGSIDFKRLAKILNHNYSNASFIPEIGKATKMMVKVLGGVRSFRGYILMVDHDKKSYVKNIIQSSIETKNLLMENDVLVDKIIELSACCESSLRSGGKIIFCGNGGSFADAQHLSAEFTSRFLFDRPSLPSLTLGANSSAISAIGNDYGFEEIFAREISSIATPSDIIIAISTSGNSANIIKAVHAAKSRNVPIWVLTGNNGGALQTRLKQ